MKLEEMLNMIREDKTLEFEFEFFNGGKGGNIYIEPDYEFENGDVGKDVLMICGDELEFEPFTINDFMLNTEYYLIEKGIKFKDMEEDKKYKAYNRDDVLIYGKVDGLLFLFNVDDYSSLEMHSVANMKFKEIDK